MDLYEEQNFCEQYPLPPEVRMVVDYKKIDHHKWCLILNGPFYYNPVGLSIDLSPSFNITYKVQVKESAGAMLIISSVESLLSNAIVGSLIFSPISFLRIASFSHFEDLRKSGCYVNAMKEIFETHNITGYTLKRF